MKRIDQPLAPDVNGALLRNRQPGPDDRNLDVVVS